MKRKKKTGIDFKLGEDGHEKAPKGKDDGRKEWSPDKPGVKLRARERERWKDRQLNSVWRIEGWEEKEERWSEGELYFLSSMNRQHISLEHSSELAQPVTKTLGATLLPISAFSSHCTLCLLSSCIYQSLLYLVFVLSLVALGPQSVLAEVWGASQSKERGKENNPHMSWVVDSDQCRQITLLDQKTLSVFLFEID